MNGPAFGNGLMVDKKTMLMRAFNQQFADFISDIQRIFPENKEISISLLNLENIKKVNPALIPRIWFKYIYYPYRDVIHQGDLSFFFHKNYAEDLTRLANAEKIMRIIDKIREPVKDMDTVNQTHTMKYIQLLSQVSAAYAEAADIAPPVTT